MPRNAWGDGIWFVDVERPVHVIEKAWPSVVRCSITSAPIFFSSCGIRGSDIPFSEEIGAGSLIDDTA
jgi:hypothetical protein